MVGSCGILELAVPMGPWPYHLRAGGLKTPCPRRVSASRSPCSKEPSARIPPLQKTSDSRLPPGASEAERMNFTMDVGGPGARSSSFRACVRVRSRKPYGFRGFGGVGSGKHVVLRVGSWKRAFLTRGFGGRKQQTCMLQVFTWGVRSREPCLNSCSKV